MATTQTIHGYTAASAISATSDYLLIDPASTGNYNKITRNVLLGITGSPLGSSDTQTITNKTIGVTNTVTALDSTFSIVDNGDNTKVAQFQASGISTGTTRTYTLPNVSDTLVGKTTTDTLTNKTLTSPAISGGTIDNSTITVDSISGHTTSTVVTVGGVQMNNGTIGTSGAVTGTSIAAGAVTPNSLVASSGSGWVWQTFTPSWTNLTPGNGTVNGRYTQIGKMVWVFISFVLGNTSSVGTNPGFTPPVAASSLYTTIAANTPTGFGFLVAGSVTAQAAPFFNASNALIDVGFYSPSATSNGLAASSATAPGTWTTGNQISINCFYEAA